MSHRVVDTLTNNYYIHGIFVKALDTYLAKRTEKKCNVDSEPAGLLPVQAEASLHADLPPRPTAAWPTRTNGD
jgi:hypothetical protein